MAPAVLLVVMIASMAVQMLMANKAARDQQNAREAAAKRQNTELQRQRERNNRIAAAKKSDAARVADREIGSAIAVLGDRGGTEGTLGRKAGDIGGILGIDIARIEGNRVEENESRRFSAISVNEEVKAAGRATNTQQVSNLVGFFGKAAGAAAGGMGGGAAGAGASSGSFSSSSLQGFAAASQAGEYGSR
jgi:hypothetical protein